MIFCPECGNILRYKQGTNSLECNKCKVKITETDGTVIFHPDDNVSHDGMESCLHDDLYENENRHFWTRHRMKVIGQVFDKYIGKEESVIEIGAGPGGITKYLLAKGYENISVGEVHLSGLEYAKNYGIRKRYQFDLTKSPFKEHFDVVGMFDVLEHIDDDVLAIKNINKMLNVGGKVVITVPAHRWLWSKQDAISYHRRRYETRQLKELFEKNGFKIVKLTTFFISILPLLFLRTIFDRDNGILIESDFKDRLIINPVINFILGRVLNIENKLLNNFSMRWGGSILLVAEKSA